MRFFSALAKPALQTRPHKLATLPILAVALTLRLLVLYHTIAHFPHDWLYTARGIEMGALAHSLVTGHGLSSPFGASIGSTGPTALIAPGYPALVALIFLVFGSFTFASAIAVIALQVCFSVLTVLVIMRLARQLFDVHTANLAGAFWAVSLPLLWMPTIFWETCLSTLLLAGSVESALRLRRTPSLLLWMLMGVGCGLTALINPALIPSLIAIFLWAAWPTYRMSPRPALIGMLLFFLVFLPWPVRNARVLHAFIPLRSTVGFELWMGNHPGASGFLEESLFPIFNKQESSNYISQGEVTYMHNKSLKAKAYIRAHPGEFLRLTSLRCFRFWTGTGNRNSSMVFALHAGLTTSLGLAGLCLLFHRRRGDLGVLFLLPLVLFPLPYYITHAEFRYRLVIDPLVTILAAYAVCEWGAYLQRRSGAKRDAAVEQQQDRSEKPELAS